MTVFPFSHLNPPAAERYLSSLDPDAVRHREMETILRSPGTLAKAAPAALADFALGAIIEKEDPDDLFNSKRDRFGPFGVHDHLFSPASPGQGPFFELLEHAPAEGLRLIRGLVEHATQWRRDQYIAAGRPFPRISIPFPAGEKSFEGDWSIYQWARSVAPSVITASALMALEAWGHQQIEAGRPFEEVLYEVLGPDGSSLAFVSVAVDLVLSHWREARDEAWPMVATPELLEFDDARLKGDLVGVDRMLAFKQEASTWRVTRADLVARPSRRNRLSDTIGYYVFHAEPKQLEVLRAALEQARNEISQKPDEGEDPINGLRATAERAVRMTNAEHWPLVKVKLEDGSEMEVRQFQRDPEEVRLLDAENTRTEANERHYNVRARVQLALFDRAKSTAEIVAEGIEWAKAQPANGQLRAAEDDEQENFDKEWDRRAVVMAGALAARDYEASDRSDVLAWALPVLLVAAAESGEEYPGNDQIEYNVTAIGALGLIALYLRDQDVVTRDALLRLARHQNLAVLKALGLHFPDLAVLDSRLPRALVGALVGYLISLTVGELPPWVVALAAHLMRWTDEANGPHGEEDRDRDNRPDTWNIHFFEFLRILCVALPHEDVVAMFLDPITRFKDEAFHDAMAEFLRGFDQATQAIDTKNPDDPVGVRALLAGRIRHGWNFKRLADEKGFTSETHSGDALNAMFYQPPRFANRGRPSIPDNWNGLDATMPTLIALVTGAPSSGYLATLFLNLVEASPRAALLSFVVEATRGWCSAYGVDTNFWSEKEIGGRVCGWLDRTFTADSTLAGVLPGVAEDLVKCLDILIQSGVVQAREIEERIAGMGPNHKTA